MIISLVQADTFPLHGTIMLAILAIITFILVCKSKFQLHYHINEKNQKRVNSCSYIKKGVFFPTPYLAHGALQAFFGKASKYHDKNIQFSEEVLVHPCGGKIGMHWATQIVQTENAKQRAKKAVVIMIPGLTASSGEPYIRNVSSEALENGYKVVVYHNRGNRVEMTFPSEGHIDPILDFKHAVDYVHKILPDHSIFAVGHSYGANTLVNYLGRYKDTNPIKAAASIANPFDFPVIVERGAGTIFDGFLAQVLKNWAKRNENALIGAPKHLEVLYEKAIKAKSGRDFDESITRRIFGFRTLDQYYVEISSKNHIKNINVPLLCINSKDDPVLFHGSIPVQEIKQNENIILIITNNGGHVGWFEGIFQPKRWYPKPTMEFLNCCFEEMITKVKTN